MSADGATTTERAGTLPGWLVALSIMVLVGTTVLFGLVPLLSPGTAFPLSGEEGEFPVRFLAIRHLAFAAPLLYGIVTRNRTVLATMFAVFSVMAVLDAITLGIGGYALPYLTGVSGWAAAAAAAGVFVAPMSIALRALLPGR